MTTRWTDEDGTLHLYVPSHVLHAANLVDAAGLEFTQEEFEELAADLKNLEEEEDGDAG